MQLDTKYYSSQYTRVIYDRTQTVGAGAKTEKAENRKEKQALRRIESRNLALSILLGKKINNVRPFTQNNMLEGLYNNYSAKGAYVYVKHEHAEITIDNSGPCTSNTSLDATIDVSEYIRRAQASNEENLNNAGDEFSWNNSESMTDIVKAYNQALNDKYSFLRDEALKHADPMRYINDKYNNPESPFYASDLTDSQRKIGYWNERDMLKKGRITGVHFGDSLFGDTFIKGQAKDADERIFNRRMINRQLSNMLSKAEVSIPDGVNLICTVDATTCRISVSDQTGDNVDRSKLISQIENTLNKGNNGLELYIHIRNSCSSMERNESRQLYYEGWVKFNYLHNVEKSSWGMDGDYNKKFRAWCEKYNYGLHSESAQAYGFDGIPDMNLQIGLSSDGFYDVYQDVNWSNMSDKKIVDWYSETEFSVLSDVKNTMYYTRLEEVE